ncbi:hypothetical protein [Mycolicibacter icosiumassiliensis]|uniref:hypothetical protein n=1 Tax=Mycolicibacter icosiumassiliensis TaxID=1792835 RepID=UPI000A70FC29|nr:hypothetical protein [Mycolicibacter icosiumassiliensis]
MSDTDEGIDRERTTHQRAGLVFKDRRELPGLALLLTATLGEVTKIVRRLVAGGRH